MKNIALIIALALLFCAPLMSISCEEALAGFRGPVRSFVNTRFGSMPASNRPQRLTGYIEQNNYNGWADTYAMGLVYDDQGRLSGWVTKMWNSDLQLWEWDWRGDVIYLPDGRYNRVDQYSYADGWNHTGYTRFVYNGARVDTLVSYNFWDNMEFETVRTEYRYSLQTGCLESVTDLSNMIDRYLFRQTYGYDSRGRLSTVTESNSWDGLEWQNNTRVSFSYHATDTSNYSQFYDYLIDGTVFSFWLYGETQAPFKLLQRDISYYNPDTLEWETGSRDQSYYDQNDRLDYRDYCYFNHDEGVWVIWNRYTYNYTPDGLWNTVVISSDEPDVGWWDFSRYNLTYEDYTDGDDQVQPASTPSIKAWPNPFNPSTAISFTLPSSGNASLAIYNLKGQLVRTLLSDLDLVSGDHSVVWNGCDDSGRAVSSGLFFGRLSTAGKTSVVKMLLAK